MRDDFLGAEWSANHHRLTGYIHKLTSRFLASMEVLTRQRFHAPWNDCATPR